MPVRTTHIGKNKVKYRRVKKSEAITKAGKLRKRHFRLKGGGYGRVVK